MSGFFPDAIKEIHGHGKPDKEEKNCLVAL
jgi:hypothetical protein